MDVESVLSSSDEEEGLSKSEDRPLTTEAEPMSLLSDQDDFQPQLSSLNLQVDEDLLNPFEWARKLSTIEGVIKQNHENRRSWPRAWRHSDSKTCPKSLKEIWSNICAVDKSITDFGLDASPLPLTNLPSDSKHNGTLLEVLQAFSSQLLPEVSVATTSSQAFPASAFPQDPEVWDTTCQEVLKLLQARDFLIMLCRDTEHLNELHPSMDAITWFQKVEPSRPPIIELKSVCLLSLAKIITTVNTILQATLWSWSNQSRIRLDCDVKKTRLHREIFVQIANLLKLDSLLEIFQSTRDSIEFAKLVADEFATLGLELVLLNEAVEKLCAILSQALPFQCEVHIASSDSPEKLPLEYGTGIIPDICWTPQYLGCMNELIRQRVWVLMPDSAELSTDSHNSTQRAYIRTKIIDLARIWGPIWKLSELEGSSWIWYRLPGGYIGQSPKLQSPRRPDESPCHFSKDPRAFGRCHDMRLEIPRTTYLLIGQSLPSELVEQPSCQIHPERALQGLSLQTVGTLRPFRYKDSTTVQVGLRQGGASANWSIQFKTNPGVLAKDSLLQRWKFEPAFRNPRLLLLWYGIEISLCTRNARRCRVVDLLRSQVIIQYLEAVYRPQEGSDDHVSAMFSTLRSSNPFAFVELYDSHPEWQADLGLIVARCLELLKDTGVDRNGDFAAFTFMENFDDVEQLAILPRKTHTWIGLLKDSFNMATFAIVSTKCLEYPETPGQRCRQKYQDRTSKSILETSYVPAERLSIRRLFQTMYPKDQLRMKSPGRFKIKERSSRGILLGTWDPFRYWLLPSSSIEEYQEKRQGREQAIKVFVISRREQRLPRLKTKRRTVPKSKPTDLMLKEATSSDQEDQSNYTSKPATLSSRSVSYVNKTESLTEVSSQAKSRKSPPSSATEIGTPTPNPETSPSSPPFKSASSVDVDIAIKLKEPKLVDKATQANFDSERPILHQRTDSEREWTRDPSSTVSPSSARPPRRQKQKTNGEHPILHQGEQSNTDRLSSDVDDLTNASREKRRQHGDLKTRRKEERNDAESPPHTPHRRQRSRTSFKEGGTSKRAIIAKSLGLGYNR